MTQEIPIYWDDLNQDAQLRLQSLEKQLNKDFPIATIVINEDVSITSTNLSSIAAKTN